MNWYRSWPETVPEGRAYVVDSLPRLVMRDQNYATLADYQPWPDETPGWCLLEWDVALASEERRRFVEHALVQPDRVLVAPYPLYPKGKPPQLVHRVKGRPVPDGQSWAHTFGFGCVYFPKIVLDRWWSEMPPQVRAQDRWNDTVFSTWYRRMYGPVEIDWSVHPQHLR